MKMTECEVCGSCPARYNTWLSHCKKCGFWCSDLDAGGGTDVEGLEDLRRLNFEVLLDRLETHRRLDGADLLEVGPAHGWFLEAARRRGARVAAIEPDGEQIGALRARFGNSVEQGFFPVDLKNRGPFDCIVFNDVFEHIPRPSALVPLLEDLLRPGGLVVVNCPSSDGIFYRVALRMNRLGLSGPLERLWQKGFASPHLSYFSPATLRALIENNGRLRQIDWFALDSVSRKGLYRRLGESNDALTRTAVFVPVYLLSFGLKWMRPDIQVAVFRL